MSVIESTTGHSRGKERSIARILYMAIIVAVLVGVAVAMLAGRSNKSLNPYGSESPQQVAPDRGAPPTAPGNPTH